MVYGAVGGVASQRPKTKGPVHSQLYFSLNWQRRKLRYAHHQGALQLRLAHPHRRLRGHALETQ